MTAPAAALVSGAIAAPTLRAAPQAVNDRFAFGAMLDSLPGAAAKAGSSVAEEGTQTSNETKQEQSLSGQSDGHPLSGDGAFLSSLPFALQSGLAASQGPAADVAAAPLPPSPTRATRLETSGAYNAALVDPAKPAAARLTGERAFHFSPSTSGVVSAGPSPAAGAPAIDAPTFALAPAPLESETGALGPSTLAPLSTQGRLLTHGAASSPPSAPVVSLSPAEAAPVAGVAPAISKASPPVAPRGAQGSASPSVSPKGAAPQDSARTGRKAETDASPFLARAASPAVSSAKAEPVDKADAGPLDQAALGGQPAPQGSVFGTPLFASVAGPSFGPNEAPAATDVVPGASAPTLAAQSPGTAPVKEIDVDLSPGGLEDVSMTMRLSGDRLSVIIRAASSQTKGTIEGARDAIADRLAAIGQPLDSLVIRQAGVNTDANANGNGASADDSPTGDGRQSGQGAGEQGASGDASSSRRGAARDRSF